MSTSRPPTIELKLQSLQQLFNSLDPSPFHLRDLDRGAEEFIVGWMMEHPLASEVTLVVHVEQAPEADSETLLRDAVHNYFDYRASMNRIEMRRLLREGGMNLALALGFLILCMIAGESIADRFPGNGAVTREGLTILGWVAMWRPLHIFLYRWWPLHRKGRFLRKLARMPVVLTRSRSQDSSSALR